MKSCQLWAVGRYLISVPGEHPPTGNKVSAVMQKTYINLFFSKIPKGFLSFGIYNTETDCTGFVASHLIKNIGECHQLFSVGGSLLRTILNLSAHGPQRREAIIW